MKKNRIIAAAVIFSLATASPVSIYAEESSDFTAEDTAENTTQEKKEDPTGDSDEEETAEETTEENTEDVTEPTTEEPSPVYKVTFLDFDGEIMTVLDVTEGDAIDYSIVDTSVLRKHVDKYTEQEFAQWSSHPETADSDITLKALYRTATLKIESEPTKRRYVTTNGSIDTSGLIVSITVETQLPETDDTGRYKIDKKIADISTSCIAKPASLEEAFSGDKNEARIEIFPIGDTKALASYSINLVRDIGDVNRDGKIDAIDASRILRAYAELNSDEPQKPSEDILKYGDINDDGVIDAVDASFVLRYYVVSSAHGTPDWTEIAGIK